MRLASPQTDQRNQKTDLKRDHAFYKVDIECDDIGFTGSREGMTSKQIVAFSAVLWGMKPTAFHHGCCIGADEQAHRIAEEIEGIVCHLHRPLDPSQMALGLTGVEWGPAPYLKRNRIIVRNTGRLIGAPAAEENRAAAPGAPSDMPNASEEGSRSYGLRGT